MRSATRAAAPRIRSVVISHKLLGTLEWFLIHGTNCGMELFCEEIMGEHLEGSPDRFCSTARLGRTRSRLRPSLGQAAERSSSRSPGRMLGWPFQQWLTI